MRRGRRISLFSQSLFALPLDQAIQVTADLGFPAIELACAEPHFGLATACHHAESVAERVGLVGLAVSALSLFNDFTHASRLEEEVGAATVFIRLAPQFKTRLVKLTPGPPASADADAEHWRCLEEAMERLVPVAEEVGVRLAFETHMRQLTDTLASSKWMLQIAPSDVIGLTMDFSNLAFAGESLSQAISDLHGRIYNTHLKNGYVDAHGGWHFEALDEGLTDYSLVLRMLRDASYDGYLTIECLGCDAKERPAETARRDLAILERRLAQVGWESSREGGSSTTC